YDNPGNVVNSKGQTRLHISEDTSINSYKYKSFLYSKKGISPVLSYSNEDRLFIGLGYKMLQQKWRKEPFASKQSLSGNYSITQKAISLTYKGLFPKFIGNWDLDLLSSYDVIRWTNFFGLGNESKFVGGEIDFYRARTTEWLGSVGFEQKFTNSTIRISPFFQSVRVRNDTQRFVSKVISPTNPEVFNTDNFVGGQLIYILHSLNNPVVPTKGISLFGNATYTQNLKESARYVGNFSGDAHVYVPLFSQVSLAIRAGAGTVTGTPEFYQYPGIGGGQTMRGFRRDRFRGETAVYNSNELRFISDVKSYLFNGKAGLLVFYDNGRVWMPGETSNIWHSGYGAGILLAPFNKVLADVTYGISKDETLIQLRLSLPIK
ncbi:MAG TPA: BamA/TamA family outer membrane protein, partial [Segetibacter sp.]